MKNTIPSKSIKRKQALRMAGIAACMSAALCLSYDLGWQNGVTGQQKWIKAIDPDSYNSITRKVLERRTH